MNTMSPSSTTEWREHLGHLNGGPPATEQELQEAEDRLGTKLPEELRSLLTFSNGLPGAGLCSTTELRWTRDPAYDLFDAWSSFEEVIELIGKCLVVLDDGDGLFCLIDSTRTADNGEWLAYAWAAGDGEDPRPFPGLSALMKELTAPHHPAGSGRPSS
ncbi:SMI1/KNR4 family protein [Kineosporia sp. NBRC 101731]|uniref:SMI1/KNR4 family protein n=1 Tax=Kineosporia sp. NBRC 101731 TaxID=3032199 RepID=UPI0024A30DA2|nr:SMI1/KNR4 family protein [Kineosporia sp. NBRC 101731]GLY27401.1 hypothetical protein Kisp02_07660 [Kineosporia sp. NBRC 101731]